MRRELGPAQVAEIEAGLSEAIGAPLRQEGEPEPLVVLEASRVAASYVEELLRQSIAAARHAGVSWTAIGEQLGVTRQAAQQRYAAPEAPVPGPRQRLLKPVTAFDELPALAEAGRHGWHSVGFGMLYHLLEESSQQWEHRRVAFPLPRSRSRLEADGWQHVGTFYPWQYFKRPLGVPAAPEDPA